MPSPAIDTRKAALRLVMVTSVNALQNLYTLTAKVSRSQLLTSKLLLGSKNQVATYQAMKFQKPPLVARSPLDRDMLPKQAAQDWWQVAEQSCC